MRRRARTILFLAAALQWGLFAGRIDASVPAAALAATDRVAKLYGAGGIGGIEAYQSGVLLSEEEGLIATANSLVLDQGEVTVVLHDGSRYSGEVLGADPIVGVALVRIEPAGVTPPAFDLRESAAPQPGDPVFALANAFGIAAGDEPVSVFRGTLAATAPLRAWRGPTARVDGGDVFLIDAVTSNPGAAGGAVVDSRGRLVGMLGSELRSRVTGAWLSYAIPTAELRPTVLRILAGHETAAAYGGENRPAPVDLLRRFGFELAPEIVTRTPPYVDFVEPGSPAADAGLRPDDLVISVDDLIAGSVGEVRRIVARRPAKSAAQLMVQRGDVFLELSVTPRNEKQP